MKQATRWLAAAAVLALTACGPKSEAPKEDATAASDEALAPGVWESVVSGEGVPGQTVRTCVDAAHAKPTLGSSNCENMKRTRTAEGVWSIEATCGAPPDGPITMTGELRGDLKTAYTITVSAQVPAGATGGKPMTLAMKVDAKKTADTCPADLPPGAIETPQGIIDSSAMKGASQPVR